MPNRLVRHNFRLIDVSHRFRLDSSGDYCRTELYGCRCGLSRGDRQNNSAQLVARKYHKFGVAYYAGNLPKCEGGK